MWVFDQLHKIRESKHLIILPTEVHIYGGWNRGGVNRCVKDARDKRFCYSFCYPVLFRTKFVQLIPDRVNFRQVGKESKAP